MAEDDVGLKFGASLDGLQAGVEEAKELIEGLSGPIKGIVDSFGELGEAIATAFAIEKVAEFAEGMGELGEQTERTSKILGISTEQVGELNYAAKMTGTSTENMTMMISRFEAGLANASSGTDRIGQGLKVLGLNAKELIGIPLEAQLDKIADAVSHLAYGVNKTAAVAALGRGFVQLIPLLDEGSRGFEELRQKADETNSILDEMATARLADMQHGMVNLGASISGVTQQAFTPFIGVVNGAVALMTDLAKGFSDSVVQGGFFKVALDGVAYAFKQVEQLIGETILILKDLWAASGAATELLAEGFRGAGQAIADVFQALAASIPGFFTALVTAGEEAVSAIGRQFSELGTVIEDVLKLNFSGAKAAFGAMGDDAGASAAKIAGAFKGVFDFSKADADMKASINRVNAIVAAGDRQIVNNAIDAKSEYDKIWGVVSRHGEGEGDGGELPTKQAAAMQPTGKGKADHTAVDNAEADAKAELEMWEANAQAKTDLLNRELESHKITMGQWLTQTKDALQDEAQDVEATYAAELKTAGLTYKQIEDLKTEEARKLKEIVHQVSEAEDKAAKDSEKSWDSAMKTINHAFESQINALLTGTETWHTAFKKVITDLTEQLIKFGVNSALTGIENIGKSALGIGALGGDGAQTANTTALTTLTSQITLLIGTLTREHGRDNGQRYGFDHGIRLNAGEHHID